MILRVLAVCLLLVSIAEAQRGPSTQQERKQALDYIRHFQADPLNPDLKGEMQWVVNWTREIPDIRLDLCTSFYMLSEPESKNGQILFDAMVFAQTAFVLENPDRQDDGPAQVEAGVEGMLHVYEILMRANAKDRQPFLDMLIKRRDAGSLKQFVKDHTSSSCNN